MEKLYKEYKQLNLPAINREVLEFWKQNDTFRKSIDTREGAKQFTFYEGPPSANGMPGIHHVMARAIKDIFCRYKTLQGFQVKRKAGWDTHGLPVELQVEKELGITKEDIGTKITIEEYNRECRKAVMKYTDKWNELTEKMGYWVDMEDPYVTYDNKYIESVWWLLEQFHEKDLLYKGYTIQPYSPAAGTGLSTHELNQPGCYRNVKDTTIVAQFSVLPGQQAKNGVALPDDAFFLAWTTTPWTLPSNTALATGKDIAYVMVKTFNPYTYLPVNVILAKDLAAKYFPKENEELSFDEYKPGDKRIPYSFVAEFKGHELEGLRYEQLLPYAQPQDGDAFRVVTGDFVSTEDGTGIVHIAPSHGSDDFRTAKQNGIGHILVVDKQGRFTSEVTDMAGEYVKEEYLSEVPADYKPVDVRIAIKLKEANRAFRVEKYEHTYPHCWRTDKPVLYYPLDSWFIRTTAIKDKLIGLNKTINWKPEATGTGRFGNWLENLLDWNLSRSRYWGIPLPIWRTEDGSESVCIGSVAKLSNEVDKAIAAGLMEHNPYALENGKPIYHVVDLHRPYVDDIVLVSPSGRPMYREKDLIDVWFDSGAMPYAQVHYPFENRDTIDDRTAFPADFIAEGVDQTRGWFFTLHVIAAAIFDSVAYKNVVSNGLVLDKRGQKMSKRLGNAVDPFLTIDQYGSDAVRWYMISNAEPWDNLKFDPEGITEVQRKFFGTLYNTYAFFALYANVDGFVSDEENATPAGQRPEFDQWILSELQSLVKEVTAQYEDYNPTKAARAIQDFVSDRLSNWYVRLSRRRFWKGQMTADKKAAYETLHECLVTISQLMSPIAPFFAEWLYRNMTGPAAGKSAESVHLTHLAPADESLINPELEACMDVAQKLTSLVLSLRKKHKIRVRQPLQKMMVPVLDAVLQSRIAKVKDLVLSEVNVKELEYISPDNAILVKKIKPDFKKLGPKYGKLMKEIAQAVQEFDQQQIVTLEREGTYEVHIADQAVTLQREDVEITSQDIPGWLVATEYGLTVALDITLTEQLKEEGLARDIVNRLQNLRKDRDYDLTDRIYVKIKPVDGLEKAVQSNFNYICSEILAEKLELSDTIEAANAVEIELEDEVKTLVEISLVN